MPKVLALLQDQRYMRDWPEVSPSHERGEATAGCGMGAGLGLAVVLGALELKKPRES